MASVIEKAELSPDQVKVVCSTSGESKAKNARKLGANFPIEQPSDPVKKINFYTSTAFEGCDIYDEFGRIYIVSDAAKSHTLMDISTLFVQICGRIRNSIYATDITHIYSTTRYSEDVSLEQFIESTEKTLAKAVKLSTDTNDMPEDSRRTILVALKDKLNEQYVTIDEASGLLVVDKNLPKVDIVNFKITKQLYKSPITLHDELRRNGFGIAVKTVTVQSPADELELNPKSKVSFQELFDEYAAIREQPITYSFDSPHYKLTIIEDSKPLVKEAYEGLGKAEVQRLKYNQTNIRRELVKKLDISTTNKIVKLIDKVISHHEAVPISIVREKLQAIYDALGIARKAKATDLAT